MPAIDELVYNYYETPGVAEGWSKASNLLPAEEKLLDRLADRLSKGRVLDIGVGPGRTARHLEQRSRHYIGIDYSEKMLRPCRTRNPDLDLALCDARRLAFSAEAFDAVLFLFNAIDDVGHEDRLSILREILRVLRPGCPFLFCAHNLDGPIKPAHVFQGFVASGTALQRARINAKRLRDYGLGWFNHVRQKKLECATPEYSILNDSSYRYRLLTYYMRKEQQIAQLEAAGFANIDVFGLDGEPVAPGLPCHDKWLHYLAWKRS